MSIDDFISSFTSSQSANTTHNTNESERDGNSNDLLFRFEQAGLQIAGGDTFTEISPFTAVSDLTRGVLSKAAIIWLVITAILIWWLMRNK